MSITLELSPELEAHLRADAAQQHISVELLALSKLSGAYGYMAPEKSRLAALDRLHGALTDTGMEMDDFLDEKRTDVERELAQDAF